MFFGGNPKGIKILLVQGQPTTIDVGRPNQQPRRTGEEKEAKRRPNPSDPILYLPFPLRPLFY